MVVRTTGLSPSPTEPALSAASVEAHHRDAELLGLVGEVLGDAVAREGDDADRHGLEHAVVALERSRVLCFAQSGLNTTWATLRLSAQQAAMRSAPFG